MRRWLDQHGWHYHDQDLRGEKGAWFDWRGWLGRYTADRQDYRDVFNYQICIWPRWKHWALGVEVSQRSIKPHVSTPWFALYMGFKGVLAGLPMWKYLPGEWRPSYQYDQSTGISRPTGPRRKYVESAATGINLDHGSLHWQVWHPTMSHRSDMPRWRYGYIDFPDLILGRAKVGRKVLGPKVQAWASFPEGRYPLILQRQAMRWKRPRWPKADIREYVEIELADVHNAPMMQGKGENSWDCDDDMIVSMSSDGLSYEHAIAKYTEAVLRDRRRYGHVDSSHRAVETAMELPL